MDPGLEVKELELVHRHAHRCRKSVLLARVPARLPAILPVLVADVLEAHTRDFRQQHGLLEDGIVRRIVEIVGPEADALFELQPPVDRPVDDDGEPSAAAALGRGGHERHAVGGAEKEREVLVVVLAAREVEDRRTDLAADQVFDHAYALIHVRRVLAFDDRALSREERAVHHQRDEAEDDEREDQLDEGESGLPPPFVWPVRHEVGVGAKRRVRIV